MRASKEQAELARSNFALLTEKLEQAYRPGLSMKRAMTQVGEFLNVAKRRLPSEASYERDRQRKQKATK